MKPGVLLAILLVLPALGDEAPSWLRELATAKLPEYEKKPPAAVLLKHDRVVVDESGRVTTITRYAVRILTSEGRDLAIARALYQTDGGKVKTLEAWRISPGGEVKKFGKNETADLALINDDIYNQTRARVILAKAWVDPGSTFGFEAESEERSVFTQFDWPFQDELPVRLARFELALPVGWRAEAITFNHTAVEPQISGTTYTWQLHDLSALEMEEAGPEISSLAPRLAVSFFAPVGSKSPGRSFSKWNDVSKWLSELNEQQATPSEALAAKARDLASNKTEFERIEAIGRYVQGVRYVSIQMGELRGGGYKPHSASQVFEKGYGDCKDKANLMRAMLRTVGVEAWPVVIYRGDRMYVRAEWPSPQQFNHAIVAVRVSEQVKARAVVEHTALGRLLFFDPTDEYTPLGWLPQDELGSQVLIVAGEQGELVRMPSPDATARSVERRTEAILSSDGGITVNMYERSIGDAAVANRGFVRSRGLPEYQKLIERWIASGANAATISRLEPKEAGPAEFTLVVNFSAPRYAQLIQGRLLVFRPAIIASRGRPNLNQPSRKSPIILEAESFAESLEVELPKGFSVDELPEPSRLIAPFGSWQASMQVKEGKLIFSRSLQLETTTIPPERYAEAREFFNQVSRSEQATVVLIRQ
jgi:hypothetical protein